MPISADEAYSVAKSVADIKQHSFQDLWYRSAKTNNQFSKVIDKNCSYVRISVPEGQALHLSSMRFWITDDDGLASPLDKLVSADLGSHYDGHTFKPEKLLDFQDFGMLLHTEKHNPFVTLTIPNSMLHRLEINNCDGKFIARGWKIEISISNDGEKWEKVYSHNDRVTDFKNQCRDTLSKNHRLDLINDTIELISAGCEAPRKLREQILAFARKYSVDARNAVSDVLNEFVLFHQALEMTASHGAQNTFRFWSEEKKISYTAFASDAIKLLRDRGHQTFLGYGPLLGYAREGGFIKHDDDIDLVMIVDREPDEPIPKLVKRFHDILAEAGFDVLGDYPNHRHIAQKNRPKVLDVFLAVREGDEIYFNPAKVQHVPVEDVLPLMDVHFMGHSVAIPRNLIGFLDKMYGENWRTPMPRFHHNWKPLS